MKLKRTSKLLIEPPSAATGDIAFNLIVFFLICASVQPEKGIRLQVPSSETVQNQRKQENVEIVLTFNAITVNGEVVRMRDLRAVVAEKLKGKTTDNDRVVVIKPKVHDAPSEQLARVIGEVKQAGGIITLQVEEVQTQIVN